MKRILASLVLLSFWVCAEVCPAAVADTTPAFVPKMETTPEGGMIVTTPGYTAEVNGSGLLSSLKVKGLETLGGPISTESSVKLGRLSLQMVNSQLVAKLAGPGVTEELDYSFLPEGVRFESTWHGKGFGGMRIKGSDALQGIELLNDKSPMAGDAVTFVKQGQVRGVPAFRDSRDQVVRFHYPGFTILTYVQRWGAPFNYESAGSIEGRSWQTQLLQNGKPFSFFLKITPDATHYQLPAIPFAPRTPYSMSLYYADEPCLWNLDFGKPKDYQPWLAGGLTSLQAQWRLTDIHDKTCGEGETTLALKPGANGMSLPVTIKTPGSGWYQALFTLSDPTGRMAPSQFKTRFTVINHVAGSAPRPALADKVDDYSIVSTIGVGAVRESHSIKSFISDTAPSKPDGWEQVPGADPPTWFHTKSFDQIMDQGSAESKQYGTTWFFQWNGRPKWMTPSVLEAVAFAMVSRGKDRCKYWEVENEPNDGYSPKDYLEKAVIPFSTGAKRADPNCVVMGPDCVGVAQTLRFMDTIYAQGGGKYLDQISTHSYPGPGESWEQFGNVLLLERLHAMMKANGDQNKPLWQTEQGYSWDLNPKFQAAKYAVRQFLEGARLGIPFDRNYYFYPQFHGFESWYQAGGGPEGSRDSWLPLAASQRFMAENLVGTHYIGDLPLPYKGISLARFSGPAGDVVAAWTFDFPMDMPVSAPGLVRAVGYDDNPLALKKLPDGRVVLPLSGEPIYLHLTAGSQVEVGRAWGRNLAQQSAGATAVTSATAAKSEPGFANDGIWNLWSKSLDLPARTSWQAANEATEQNPAFVEIDFPVPRTLTRLLALCYLPAVNASPRDWQLQVWGQNEWKTVGSATDWSGWVPYAEFAPVTTSKVRFLVTKVNDGWMGDHSSMWAIRGADAGTYTGSKVQVTEIEAYGPESAPWITADFKLGDGTPPAPGAIPAKGILTIEAGNPRDTAESATLVPQLPAGFSCSPALAPLSIAAHGRATVTFDVKLPAAVTAGQFPLTVSLHDGGGTLLDVAAAPLDISLPLEAKTALPGPVTDGKQNVTLSLKNTATVPLSGSVALQIPQQPALTMPFGPVEAGQKQDVIFTAPQIPVSGVTRLSYTVRVGNTIMPVEQRLYQRGWLVLGPFPDDFDASYSPEKAPQVVNAGQEAALPDGKSAQWKRVADGEEGYVNLQHEVGTDRNTSAYVYLSVKSPVARQAVLALGFHHGAKVWWNDVNVLSTSTSHQATPDQYEVTVPMKAGWNHLLVRLLQTNGKWGLYADFLDAKTHAPLTDLDYQP